MSAIHIPTGQFVLRNAQTGTYLNAFNYMTNPGINIVMCTSGPMYTNDRWNLTANLSVQHNYTYTYTLQSASTLLVAASGNNGAAVLSNDPTKQWILVPGVLPYSYAILPVGEKTALEPLGDSVANATPVELTALSGTPTLGQSWFIIAADYAEASFRHW